MRRTAPWRLSNGMMLIVVLVYVKKRAILTNKELKMTNQINALKKQKAYAWAQYFNAQREQVETLKDSAEYRRPTGIAARTLRCRVTMCIATNCSTP